MQIKALPVKQDDVPMYLGTFKIKDLIRTFKVDVWEPTNTEGYQRKVSERRARSFGKFIAMRNISPPTILINIREEDASKVKYNEDTGILEIQDDAILWIVDGQHRLKGLELILADYEEIGEKDLGAVITVGLSKYEEAKQFVIINKTQKGVRSDLAERFLQKFIMREGLEVGIRYKEEGVIREIVKDIEWRPKAIQVTDLLNKDSESVWYQKIKLPNMPAHDKLVAQKSFTDSLRPIVTHRDLEHLSAEDLAKIINNYWNALKELMPEAFLNPSEYIVQKTTGAFVFHGLFPTIIKYTIDENGNYNLTKEAFKEVLSLISDTDYLESENWLSSKRGIPGGKFALMGVSQKTFRTLIGAISATLSSKAASIGVGKRGVVF